MEMNPIEDIREQRRAIMSGKWVQRDPSQGEACAVIRYRQFEDQATQIGEVAVRALAWAVAELNDGFDVFVPEPTPAMLDWTYEDSLFADLQGWNDFELSPADSDGPNVRSLADVLAALDRAEVILKECGYEEGA